MLEQQGKANSHDQVSREVTCKRESEAWDLTHGEAKVQNCLASPCHLNPADGLTSQRASYTLLLSSAKNGFPVPFWPRLQRLLSRGSTMKLRDLTFSFVS